MRASILIKKDSKVQSTGDNVFNQFERVDENSIALFLNKAGLLVMKRQRRPVNLQNSAIAMLMRVAKIPARMPSKPSNGFIRL
jgi:hypothetical protein